ncbi:MAG: hypothetical protein BYD32DRAFT_404564 [Podila humilis]|nr:MAG: hypothetical protein BYD32DRAFT_404564 [Podila humilis]
MKLIHRLLPLSLSRTVVQPSSNNYSSSTSPAIHIPEIIQQVFSHLNERDLYSACVVNRFWHLLSLDFLHVQLHWSDTGPAEEQDRAVKQLTNTRVRTFRLFAQDSRTYLCFGADAQAQVNASWERLQRAIRALAEEHPLEALEQKLLPRLETLTLNGESCLDYRVIPILAYFSSLSIISLTGMTPGSIDLAGIFQNCPRLTDFSLICPETSFTSAQRNVQLRDIVPGSLSSTNLRRLHLRHVFVGQSTLELLLTSTPELRSCECRYLVANGASPSRIDRRSFIDFAKKNCRQLELFHFSIRGERMQPSEAEIVGKYFPSTTARVWDMDFTQANVPHLLSNRITSLEIHHMSSRSPGVSSVLHGFLCESPSLLHLKVNHAFYPCENFVFGSDLYGDLSALGYPNELGRHDLPAGLNKRIWACRGLLTLHLQFDSRYYSIRQHAFGTRAMFAYLATVCPRLQDVSIHRPNMDLGIDSGFCHLAILRDLEKLTISTDRDPGLKAKDLMWFRVTTTAVDVGAESATGLAASYPKLLDEWTSELSAVKLQNVVDQQLSDNLHQRGYISSIGSATYQEDIDPLVMIALPALDGVVNRLSAIYRGHYSVIQHSNIQSKTAFGRVRTFKTVIPCWPRLESFQIHGYVTDLGIISCQTALIADYRPDLNN